LVALAFRVEKVGVGAKGGQQQQAAAAAAAVATSSVIVGEHKPTTGIYTLNPRNTYTYTYTCTYINTNTISIPPAHIRPHPDS
jgi:hypothetical protein